MFHRLLKLPLDSQSSIFLFGPRGTGKTSWLKEHLPQALYFDLLDFNTYSLFIANPSRLQAAIPRGYKDWIIIDEVQRIPELLNEVHRLIESERYRFILTGSSARSLRRKGVNLLAGRALKYEMHPLVAQEIGPTFDFQHALKYGLLPTAVTHKDPKNYLESYVHTYLREEVLQEGLTRNIGAFTSFLEVASFSQGAVLTMTEIGRELGISRFTLANYFAILDDLLLSVRIPPFTLRAKRATVAHNKFYFFDAGIYRALRPMGVLDKQDELEGASLETLFLQSVQALNDYMRFGYRIYFWKLMSGTEVDFVLYGPQGFYAFEIKRSSQVRLEDLRGLKSFAKDYPEATLYLLHMGKHKLYYGNITVLPFEQALIELPELLQHKKLKVQ